MNPNYEIPNLIGERVFLRPLEPQERPLVHQWVLEADPLTQTCRPLALLSFAEMSERATSPGTDSYSANLAVLLRGTGTLVGRVRCFDWNARNRAIEIGYITASNARGKGYAREAVGLVLGYLFDGLGVSKVQAQTGAFNASSIRLLEELGFNRDGVLREHHLYQGVFHADYLYSILAREWRARHSS